MSEQNPLDVAHEAQRVLSLGQVALWLKLPKEEVADLASKGVLPGRLLNGEWRFGALAINRWLAGDQASGELASLSREVARVTTQIEALGARIAPLLDALPQLPQGRMVMEGPGVKFDVPDGMTLDSLEAEYIRHVMNRCQNNKTRAAEVMGIDASTLYRKLTRLGWK